MVYLLRGRTGILVVDPCPADYTALVAAGQAHGVHFCFLPDGHTALESRAPARFDVAVFNIQLPDMSGLELYQLLKTKLESRPVFLVANRYRRQDEVVVLRTGTLHFLCKPIEPSFLDHFRAINFVHKGARDLPERTMP